jgi:4-oxalocrotonate tautomerase
MPTVFVEGPPIAVEKKRDLVSKIHQAMVDTYQIEQITVIIRENPPENVGVGGQLLVDRRR